MKTSDKDFTVKAIEFLTEWMDTKLGIPGTSIRFGLDALLSLIPGVGDVVSSGLNIGIFGMILAKGVPFGTAIKMMGNILIDSLISAVPVIGTFFDIGFKSNVKNLNLMQKHLASNPTGKYYKGIWLIFGLTVLLLIGVIVGVFWVLANVLSKIEFPW